MPLYDYKCKHCDAVKEDIYQSYSDPPEVCRCGRIMDRQIGTFAFKVWNYDVATQTGEENRHMCGVEV